MNRPSCRMACALLTVALMGCDAFGSEETASSSGTGSPSGIALRGKNKVPLITAKELVLSAPPETQPGDFQWVVISLGVFSGSLTAPPEFAKQGSQEVAGGECRLTLAYFSRKADAPGPASYKFTVGGDFTISGILVSYSGVDPDQPIEDTREIPAFKGTVTAGGIRYTVPTATTTRPRTATLFFLGDASGGAWAAQTEGPSLVTDTGVVGLFEELSSPPSEPRPTEFSVTQGKCGADTRGAAKIVVLRGK